MRCKKHLTDLSSSVGVCSTCLRERLFTIIAAQAQAQAQTQARAQVHDAKAQLDHQNSNPYPPPLIFPRSVSPYICRRKSDNTNYHHHDYSLPDQLFYSTPQVGPTSIPYKKKHSKFSLLSNLFRSKPEKSDSDQRVSYSNSRDSRPASTSSTSWFSSFIPGRRKKQLRRFSPEESIATGARRPVRNRDRGMSPARYSDDEECSDGSSGYSSESSQGWKQTPSRAVPPFRRGGGRPIHSRNVSGFAFCLSPLVRASPNRNWNQKGMPTQPEATFSGEIRVPVKPHLSTAASFCANRSRKLADFGRFNPNH